ncbi:hypothetical protein [Nostoc sp. FACHB-857]|uniref:Uncharacterized protein n=1 Tax=Nostoc paludosum FACHB-159 TaxID=2692908 RepID=A0ABR8K7Z6_9NOSO|nr:hypothetical protein [Nostoc sp. FACHB-857]MBD2676794.1 hypothetical protein [Nostoc sp. FACHB-857]MBD2734981.1 hypothetical protein [Nostoc paludosum FACHB-159]
MGHGGATAVLGSPQVEQVASWGMGEISLNAEPLSLKLPVLTLLHHFHSQCPMPNAQCPIPHTCYPLISFNKITVKKSKNMSKCTQ